jgi:hypothetical protein
MRIHFGGVHGGSSSYVGPEKFLLPIVNILNKNNKFFNLLFLNEKIFQKKPKVFQNAADNKNKSASLTPRKQRSALDPQPASRAGGTCFCRRFSYRVSSRWPTAKLSCF